MIQITSAPDYLVFFLQPLTEVIRIHALLYVPFTRIEVGKCAFRVSAPTVWSSVKWHAVVISTFKLRLKTTRFSRAT